MKRGTPARKSDEAQRVTGRLRSHSNNQEGWSGQTRVAQQGLHSRKRSHEWMADSAAEPPHPITPLLSPSTYDVVNARGVARGSWPNGPLSIPTWCLLRF